MIQIMKASAGSGKTWNLARQYIKLLLEKKDEFAYRHILAVTFTNKATDEMKDRILSELDRLAKDPASSDYHDEFVPSICPDDKTLAEAAEKLLCNILHDYSAFAVSTIDRFFQQTLKAFAREIGQFSSYTIELDKGSLIKESVDRLLDSLTDTAEHSRSLEWMTSKTMKQLEDGEGYRLDFTLKNIADRFNSEEFRVAVAKSGIDESALYSDKKLSELDSACDRICSDYIAKIKEAVSYVYECFNDIGVAPEETTRHFVSQALSKYFDLKSGGQIPMPTEAFKARSANTEEWFSGKNKKMYAGLDLSAAAAAISSFLALFDVEYKVYNTALQLKKQIYGFAVANDLYANFKALLKEKNVLTIDQTNTILRGIIDRSDTPFIYEKLGVRYDNFLLDEFQDTSLVQWDNFKPLLDNSVAGGNDNLIVGDVKQSIYRWRQSEWDLLEHKVQDDFPTSTFVSSLDTNYRSLANIVRFNNDYFMAAAKYLDERIGGSSDVISRIYSDVGQEINKKGEGMVEAIFCKEENYYPYILESVRKAVEKGYRLGDITVLVRLNKEGADIAEYLVANGIPVVSDDSLKVSSSITVRRLVSLLAGIENPEDSMSGYLASSLGIEVPSSWHSIVDLCEDLLRKLSDADKALFESETLYIQSFMDLVNDHVSSDGNSLRAFLKKWADDKSNISSPASEDSVRIMTVHKSKGLDFPYVIFPSLDSIGFYSFDNRWSKPDVKGTALDGVADGVYDVCLSSKSLDTLFDNRYREELLLQYVDNINVLYVALTRASKAMTLITPFPSGVEVTSDGYVGDSKTFTGFAQWTLAYLAGGYVELGFMKECAEDESAVVFCKGEFPEPASRKEVSEEVMSGHFCSWPLNPERGRLKFSADAMDFFSDEGDAGIAASNRIRGVVLHEILSRVSVPEDLEPSVRTSVLAGDLTEREGYEAASLLKSRIEEVAARGWFPSDRGCVLNECTLMDTDGQMYRPDRVVVDGDKVVVIDYKFGEHDTRYVRQVSRYAAIWRRMGYENVSAVLWYVQRGEVVDVL